MKQHRHIQSVTRTPGLAQISNFQIKLEGTTEMIDILLRAERAAPWKVLRVIGDDDNTDTGTEGTNTNPIGTEL